jgi:hypothetical protein
MKLGSISILATGTSSKIPNGLLLIPLHRKASGFGGRA